MDAELTFVGLFYVEIGTLVALGFRPELGDSEEDMVQGGTKILRTSVVAHWYHDTLLPQLGRRFVTRALPEDVRTALTVQGEVILHRIGWAAVLVGMTLQLVAQGPW